MEWTSKLKTSHTWGKHRLENLLKYIGGLVNVSIYQEAKCFNAPHLHTTNTHFITAI